ncbi:deoxynucleoside kinase [Compostibacter hankyongensis]|uniref:Deoxynucleoside kinase domain-containing protein n=1 Tax=Compostibacter hankyongensis TaxID=1007089 RepID=A0ABP8FRA9_9BACT
MQYRHITIEGNIGAGKTTLARMLAERFSGRLILEEFADNPFLPRFYRHPDRYAFPLELFFLAERYKQLKAVMQEGDLFPQKIFSDYLFEKSLLFARLNLQEDELRLYQRLFDIIRPQLPEPDLLIYLHAPVEQLQRNIRRRNRSYEQQISDAYLLRIQEMYFQYMRGHSLPALIIDTTAADFEHQPRQFGRILDALEEHYKPGEHYLVL